MLRSLLCGVLVAQLSVVRHSASQENVATVVKQSSDAVVLIVVSDSTGTETALGSGFIVSPDGKIVTNYHVMSGSHSAIVKLSNGALFPAAGVLAFDANQDLAIIKVNGKNLPFLNLADTNKLQVGDHVVAIGSPLGLEGTVSDGIISAVREEGHAKWIQTTTPVSHGNSGGPLLNMDGNVVGVITWGISLQQGQNLNFAIPSGEVNALLSKSAALLTLDSIGGVRQPTPQPAGIAGTDEKDQGEQQVINGDGKEQHAIQQLRAIVEKIKSCKPPELPPDRYATEGFGFVFGPPMNVVWDVELHPSIRARYEGSIDFSEPSYYKVPPDDNYCNKPKIKRSECKRMWLIGSQMYEKQLNHPEQFRYEFDVTDHGLEFLRAIKKTKQTDDEPWVAGGMDADGCAYKAIKSVLKSAQ